jgi:flavorubredoxin
VFEEVIARDDLRIACHRRAGTFIRYYGVQSELYHVDAHNYRLPLASGRVLEFAYTPYLHSPGAIVTFDTITRTLFTSDIFGSFSDVGRGATGAWELVATEAYLDRMAGFHCSYMPRGAFLQTALDRIERFGAATIAPQHGSVVQGELVARAIGRLRELEVGQALDEQGMPT